MAKYRIKEIDGGDVIQQRTWFWEKWKTMHFGIYTCEPPWELIHWKNAVVFKDVSHADKMVGYLCNPKVFKCMGREIHEFPYCHTTNGTPELCVDYAPVYYVDEFPNQLPGATSFGPFYLTVMDCKNAIYKKLMG